MEEYFFSNRSEQILYDLLTNYIGKQSGHNVTKYPQIRSILKNSIRNVYSIKNTYPELRNTNLTDKERISFLQKKVLRRCLPIIVGHIKQVDSRRNQNAMVPQNRNNQLGQQVTTRQFDNSIVPVSMRQPSIPIQRPQIDDPTTYIRPDEQRVPVMQPQMQPQIQPQMQPQMQAQMQAQMQPQIQPQMQPQMQPRRSTIKDDTITEGERISMETRAQLDELIQQHEPVSHNLDSGTQQSFSTLEETQSIVTNQPVEKDEPIVDLARRSDDLLREREEELKALLQNQSQAQPQPTENTNTDTSVDSPDNSTEDDSEQADNDSNDSNDRNERVDNKRFDEFQKELEDKFERNMRLKMNELNNTMTEIRGQNVQLERERDTLQTNVKQLMTDNLKNNEERTRFKNELDEYKTKYNTLLETTNEKFQNLEKQYENSKNELIQKIQTDIQTEMQTNMQNDFNLKYKEYETELKLLKEHIKKQQEIVLSQHKMIQNGLSSNTNTNTNSNSNSNSFKIFSVNRTNRIRPITWEEKTDSVGVILKKTCKIKTPVMKVDNYSVVLPSNRFPSSEVFNMKLMKILIHKCNIIGEIPEFIECHIRLNKRSEDENSIINYKYNMKLDTCSNFLGYRYHNEETQENELYTMQDISIDGNIIMNINLKSIMYPHNFIRDLNRCYEISGMSLASTSGNNVLYNLKLNVDNINMNTISKLKGLKTIAIDNIYFTKYVATDLKLYTNEQISSFEKWLMSEDIDIYNITHSINCGKCEVSIQILVSLDQFNFLKRPANHPVSKWVLRNKMDTMVKGTYGVVYFPELENKLYMEIEY